MKEETKDRSIQNSGKDKQIIILTTEIEILILHLEENQKAQAKVNKYADLLSDLFNKGIIDNEGRFINQDNEDQT